MSRTVDAHTVSAALNAALEDIADVQRAPRRAWKAQRIR
jgi:hypothetical protein